MISEERLRNIFNNYKKRVIIEDLADSGVLKMSVRVSKNKFALANLRYDNDDFDINFYSLKEIHDKEVELYKKIYLNKKINGIFQFDSKFCKAVGKKVEKIPAFLDDMAQIIGRYVKVTNNENKSIMKILNSQNAVILSNDSAITKGRSLDEAFTTALVLEKVAQNYINLCILGKFKKINYIRAKLMNVGYKIYSKQNQQNKLIEINKGALVKEKNLNKIEEEEMQIRKQIIQAGKKLLISNLTQGTWGNISYRLDDKYMLITPKGLDYLSLGPEDIMKVDYFTMQYWGKTNLQPSGEAGIHAGMMRSRKDIKVCMHSHPTYSSVFSASNLDLPSQSEKMKKLVGENAKCSIYGLPSTKKLANNTIKAMKDRNACIMANHGIFAVGKDIETTFETIKIMEESSKKFIDNIINVDKKDSSKERIEYFLKN